MGRRQIKNYHSLLNFSKLSHTPLVFKLYFPLITVLSALAVAFTVLIFVSLGKVPSENGTLPKVQTAVSFMLAEVLRCHFKVATSVLGIEGPFVGFFPARV